MRLAKHVKLVMAEECLRLSINIHEEDEDEKSVLSI